MWDLQIKQFAAKKVAEESMPFGNNDPLTVY